MAGDESRLNQAARGKRNGQHTCHGCGTSIQKRFEAEGRYRLCPYCQYAWCFPCIQNRIGEDLFLVGGRCPRCRDPPTCCCLPNGKKPKEINCSSDIENHMHCKNCPRRPFRRKTDKKQPKPEKTIARTIGSMAAAPKATFEEMPSVDDSEEAESGFVLVPPVIGESDGLPHRVDSGGSIPDMKSPSFDITRPNEPCIDNMESWLSFPFGRPTEGEDDVMAWRGPELDHDMLDSRRSREPSLDVIARLARDGVIQRTNSKENSPMNDNNTSTETEPINLVVDEDIMNRVTTQRVVELQAAARYISRAIHDGIDSLTSLRLTVAVTRDDVSGGEGMQEIRFDEIEQERSVEMDKDGEAPLVKTSSGESGVLSKSGSGLSEVFSLPSIDLIFKDTIPVNGSEVLITGSGFTPLSRVVFKDVNREEYCDSGDHCFVRNERTIIWKAPPHPVGEVDVCVRSGEGMSGSFRVRYVYGTEALLRSELPDVGGDGGCRGNSGRFSNGDPFDGGRRSGGRHNGSGSGGNRFSFTSNGRGSGGTSYQYNATVKESSEQLNFVDEVLLPPGRSTLDQLLSSTPEKYGQSVCYEDGIFVQEYIRGLPLRKGQNSIEREASVYRLIAADENVKHNWVYDVHTLHGAVRNMKIVASAIVAAIWRNDVEVARCLLTHGADANSMLYIEGIVALPALHIACMIGNYEMCTMLLKHGAQISAQNSLTGDNAAHVAALYKRPCTLIYMAKHQGTEAFSEDNRSGYKPMHYMALMDNTTALQKILELLAGEACLSKSSLTSLELANNEKQETKPQASSTRYNIAGALASFRAASQGEQRSSVISDSRSSDKEKDGTHGSLSLPEPETDSKMEESVVGGCLPAQLCACLSKPLPDSFDILSLAAACGNLKGVKLLVSYGVCPTTERQVVAVMHSILASSAHRDDCWPLLEELLEKNGSRHAFLQRSERGFFPVDYALLSDNVSLLRNLSNITVEAYEMNHDETKKRGRVRSAPLIQRTVETDEPDNDDSASQDSDSIVSACDSFTGRAGTHAGAGSGMMRLSADFGGEREIRDDMHTALPSWCTTEATGVELRVARSVPELEGGGLGPGQTLGDYLRRERQKRGQTKITLRVGQINAVLRRERMRFQVSSLYPPQNMDELNRRQSMLSGTSSRRVSFNDGMLKRRNSSLVRLSRAFSFRSRASSGASAGGRNSLESRDMMLGNGQLGLTRTEMASLPQVSFEDGVETSSRPQLRVTTKRIKSSPSLHVDVSQSSPAYTVASAPMTDLERERVRAVTDNHGQKGKSRIVRLFSRLRKGFNKRDGKEELERQ